VSDPAAIFDLLLKADEKLKYASAAHGDVRARQAGELLAQALAEAEAIGNEGLVQQAKVRIADLETILQGGAEP
jgi:hypothetical protein